MTARSRASLGAPPTATAPSHAPGPHVRLWSQPPRPPVGEEGRSGIKGAGPGLRAATSAPALDPPQLIEDKKALAERCEAVVAELKQGDQRRRDREAQVQEQHELVSPSGGRPRLEWRLCGPLPAAPRRVGQPRRFANRIAGPTVEPRAPGSPSPPPPGPGASLHWSCAGC